MSAWSPPMAYGDKAPFQSPGSFSSQAPAPNYNVLLGWKYMVNGNEFRVVKTSAAFAVAGIQGLVCADSGTNTKNHIVAAVAGAAAVKSTIAGVAATTQLALASGDFFLVQTGGRASCTAAAAGVTVSTPQICGAAGTVTDAGVISTAVWSQIIGIAHQTRTVGLVGEVELETIA